VVIGFSIGKTVGIANRLFFFSLFLSFLTSEIPFFKSSLHLLELIPKNL